MDDPVGRFVAEFHNLEGATVADKKRTLFQLFHRNPWLQNKLLQDSVTSQLNAHTHLEKLFLVDFLIYYRRFDELSQEFLKGDEIIVSKIAKHNWFFQSAFGHIGPEFIHLVLPNLSFTLRLKILKKMVPVLNLQQADEIFEALYHRYGLHVATNVLTSCTPNKIDQILKNHPIKLWPNQLKLLYNKNPNLIYVYLEERQKHEGNTKFMDANPIFEYIAQKNIDMYCDLYQKYKFKTKLGKRVTKKVIVAKRDDIIAAPELYVSNLNPGRTVRKLGLDFKQVYLKLFPRRVEDSPNSESCRLLQYYPKNGRFKLMMTTFDQVFHKKLHESPHLIDEYILKMITDADEREKWARVKGGSEPGSAYIKYLKAENCFKILKDTINLARAPYERVCFVGTIVESCLVNDDFNCLVGVGEFISQRFKNDLMQVSLTFLRTLVWSKCNFDKLDENHWKCINQVAMRPDFQQVEDYIRQVFFEYMQFLSKSNKPIEGEILRFFKQNSLLEDDMRYIRDPRVEKEFLCKIIELAPQLAPDLDCLLVALCKKYNSRNPKDKIDVFRYPRLILSVKSAVTSKLAKGENVLPSAIEWSVFRSVKSAMVDKMAKGESVLSSAVELLVCTERRSEEIDDLTKIYWNNLNKLAAPSGIRWFLRRRPELVAEHLAEFVAFAISNHELNRDKKFWRLVKCYIDKPTIEFCLSKLNDLEFKNPHYVAEALSLLMQPNDYLSLLESYKPTSHKIDLQNDEINRRFKIQRSLLKALNNINAPLGALPLILCFCHGDYVSSCVSPLYSAAYKAPENQIKAFVDELAARRRISSKKHAFHLTCALLEQEAAIGALKSCALSQAIAMTFKYFLRNPSDETWQLFVSKLGNLDKNATVARLLVGKTIPKKFKAQHFGTIWEILHNTGNNKRMLVLVKNAQGDSISGLEPELLSRIVGIELFEVPEMDKIVSNYVINGGAQDLVFDALRNFKSARKKLYDFVFTLFTTYMNSDRTDDDLVAAFTAKFHEIFRPVEAFEESIMLALMALKSRSVADFAKSIVQLHNNLIAQYGEHTVGIFAACLQKLLPYFCKTNPHIYEFYFVLVESKQSANDVLLVIKLLPTESQPEDKESFGFYNRTVAELQKVNLASVQLHLNLHFKLHKVFVEYEYYKKEDRMSYMTSSWLVSGARRKRGYMYL